METDKNYAVYIGDVALDEYYRAQRWPGKADKENVEFLKAVPGGMIANAACVRASLDQKTLFWTCMNDGAVSKFLLEDLRLRHLYRYHQEQVLQCFRLKNQGILRLILQQILILRLLR